MKQRDSQILDPTGRPFELNGSRRGRKETLRSFFAAAQDYLNALVESKLPADFKARDPLRHHPWVLAGVVALGITTSQAPYRVFVETDSDRRFRAGRERSRLRYWQRGNSVQRAWKQIHRRDLEAVEDHELQVLLNNPNPYLKGTQLFWVTVLWLAARGEAMWILTKDGVPLQTVEQPTEIWPVSPDCFEEIRASGANRGPLVAWKVKLPDWMPNGGKRVRVELDAAIHFKEPDPGNLVRGISRLSSVASGIENDLLARAHQQSILEKGGVPKVYAHTDSHWDAERREEFLEWYEENYAGPDKTGRLLALFGGLKLSNLGLSPQDMEFLSGLEWDRDEILAVLGTPGAVLGLPNKLNRATQQGMKLDWWEHRVIPLMTLIETTLDATLFFETPDNVTGMFDLTGVEVLRLGVKDKIEMVTKLTAQGPHVPPRVAYEVVGLEMPEYPADEEVFVPANLVTVETALQPLDPEPTTETRARAPAVGRSKMVVRRSIHSDFVRESAKKERAVRREYRSWIREERDLVLAAVQEQKQKKAKLFDISLVLSPSKEMAGRLETQVRSSVTAGARSASRLLESEIGDAAEQKLIDAAIRRQLRTLKASTPKSLRKALERLLKAQFATEVNFSDVEKALRKFFDAAGSTGRATNFAQTATASVMNDVKTEGYKEAGIEQAEWLDSGDEHVRADHVTFGGSGTHEIGFNYMDLATVGSGTLEFPGDTRASIEQRARCRCTLGAVK